MKPVRLKEGILGVYIQFGNEAVEAGDAENLEGSIAPIVKAIKDISKNEFFAYNPRGIYGLANEERVVIVKYDGKKSSEIEKIAKKAIGEKDLKAALEVFLDYSKSEKIKENAKKYLS